MTTLFSTLCLEKGITDKEQKFVLTTKEVAEVFGVRTNTVIKYPVQPLFTLHKANYYDIRQVAAHVTRSAKEVALDLNQQKAKLVSLQVEKAQIELGKIKQELIETEQVRKVWVDMGVLCRQKLLSVPARAAGEVMLKKSMAEVQQVLRSHIVEALEELKDFHVNDYVEEFIDTEVLDQEITMEEGCET